MTPVLWLLLGGAALLCVVGNTAAFAVMHDAAVSADGWTTASPAAAASHTHVPRLTWPTDVSELEQWRFVQEVVQARKPVVLLNSPAARWRGIASWAELYGVLAQGNGLSEVVDVQVAPAAAMHDGMAPFMYTDPESNPALYHDDAAVHDAMLPGTAGIATPMKLSELLERGCVSTDQALYFTEELGHPALEPLLGRVQPLAWMVLPDDAASAAVDMDSAEPVASLWLGGPGITTQCHYDAPLNLFAQLFGQKRFWLWPPSAAWQAHLYPELHPRARKSQVHIASNGRAHANSTVPAPGLEAPMEVVLHSGDVLFIPPLWLHHVTSLTCSAGINVFSPSVEGTALNAMLSVPLPFEQQWTMEHTITALVSLLAEVVSRFVDPAAFMRETLASRYALAPAVDGHALHADSCSCWSQDHGNSAPMKHWWPRHDDRALLLRRAASVADQVARSLLESVPVDGPATSSNTDGLPGARGIILANYVEVAAGNFVLRRGHDTSKFERVATFLDECR